MDLKSLQLGFQGSSDKKWVKVWKQKKKNTEIIRCFHEAFLKRCINTE